MGLAQEQARAGFALLKKERAANIQAHGIPEPLLHLAEQTLETLSTEMHEKLDKVCFLYGKGTLVFFLTGEESPDKNVFAILMLMLMLGAGKVVRYYIAASFDSHEIGQMAIMGVDTAKGLPAAKLITFLSTHVHNYKAAVIGGESLASIEAILGKALYDYMTHISVEVKIPSARYPIPEV